jgi:hypothetical protein
MVKYFYLAGDRWQLGFDRYATGSCLQQLSGDTTLSKYWRGITKERIFFAVEPGNIIVETIKKAEKCSFRLYVIETHLYVKSGVNDTKL